jgi:hypothetical protein
VSTFLAARFARIFSQVMQVRSAVYSGEYALHALNIDLLPQAIR